MRKEKQFLLDEVQEKIESSQALIFTSYMSFSANEATKFRNAIAKASGEYEVVRKRVFAKALAAAGILLNQDARKSLLKGHIGVVFASKKTDPVSLTKAVFEFRSEAENKLAVLGGHFEGKLLNGPDVETLSKLPSKDEMRASLLATFEAPLAQTLAVFEALMTSVPHCLQNKIDKGDAE